MSLEMIPYDDANHDDSVRADRLHYGEDSSNVWEERLRGPLLSRY